ncbi:peptidase S46 [Bacteroides sp. CAG:1060]|nr:peptidase S46 [Bacteroides sp. CAG:1060]
MIITAAIALCFAVQTKADEGMWMLPLLEKINSEALANLGSRLTPDQIYSINHSSIKDAVVQFGGGCTGEIISENGLLATNHHCGYASIQALSSEEHNYLEDGFWAQNLSEEIPVPGLSVSFLVSMEDVTGMVDTEKARKKIIKKAQKDNPGCSIQITGFYNDNVQYLIVYKVYRDVRFVGAPPASMGKFGGDTDNWMWPRHTCDFSMFRVYAGPDNQPAQYSETNVPLKPAHSLSISLKGVEEGDFAMIMGYPGRTQRFQTAAQLEEMLAINDIRIDARTVLQDVMWKEMRSDEVVGLKYANKYASSSNGWKKWQGMREAFAKLDVIGRELTKEQRLEEWIIADPERKSIYGGAIEGIKNVVERRRSSYESYILLSETLQRIELLGLVNANSDAKYKDYDADVDRKIALALTEHYLERANDEEKVNVSREYIENMFRTSAFVSPERLEAARSAGIDLSKDPAVLLKDKVKEAATNLLNAYTNETQELSNCSKKYAAALLEWQKDKPSYPDANFTCRLTYGTVKGYEPKDGVIYKYYTTLKGVIEKEDPDNYEFRVPSKVKELYQNKDYGIYADAEGNLRTCFLTNLDITGGNSGSPVLDADGNLIGLAFDGNWEAMSGDVIFEPELQRCICVDIRYVLFMMDKFGGAGYLLNEMNIIR